MAIGMATLISIVLTFIFFVVLYVIASKREEGYFVYSLVWSFILGLMVFMFLR